MTVVVLTWERPAHLRRCLESLRVQTDPRLTDIVVADDGSGPETAAVVRQAAARDPRIRHVRHEHRGIPATRNLGVAAAHGDLVAVVADDYVLRPDYVTVAVDHLAAHPDAAVVRFDLVPADRSWGARLSHCYYEASLVRRLESEGLTVDDARRGVATTTLEAAGAAMFRRHVLDDVGPWDESLPRAEDTEQTARLRAAGHQVHVLFAGTVTTTYESVPWDTLRKCWLTGRYRTRLTDETAPAPPVRDKLRALRRALDRARRGGTSRLEVVALVPGMVVFELAVAFGDAYERFSVREAQRA